MSPDIADCLLRDRRHRLLRERRAARRARELPPLRQRAASARRDIGFRLVETGLRLALDADAKAGSPRR